MKPLLALLAAAAALAAWLNVRDLLRAPKPSEDEMAGVQPADPWPPERVWDRLESIPGFTEGLRQAEADLAAGRGSPFRDLAYPWQPDMPYLEAQALAAIRHTYRSEQTGPLGPTA